MLDDHARAARLRQAPRTDLAMGERVFRFLSALQIRIVRELGRLDTLALHHLDAAGTRGEAWVIGGDAVFARGRVEVAVTEGAPEEGGACPARSGPGTRAVTTGLTVDLQGAAPGPPSVRFSLRYTAVGADPLRPDAQWFDGEARLESVSAPADDAVHFDDAWRRVCARHPSVADVERSHGRGAGPGPAGPGAGIRFERLATDPEGAFLFVRELGRAFLPAYLPLVDRSAPRSRG